MDIELAGDAFFLPPGVSPGEFVPRHYRKFVDWLMPKVIGRPWPIVYQAVVALGQVTNSALESAPTDESMERGADACFRMAVALLLEEIDAPFEITNPVQAVCYLASAHPDHASAAHVYVQNVGGPHHFSKLVEAELSGFTLQ